jgi:PBP1b-binding outer membrane lipoprotein LpoB
MNKKIMKKIIATLTLSAVLFTVGCVKKDDKADGGDKKIKLL